MPASELLDAELVHPSVWSLIQTAPRPGLGSEPRCAATRQAIEKLQRDGIRLGPQSADPRAEQLGLAGLWLLAGELDRSHTLSQSIDSASGAYWHGIMHRREGDFWNAKYWFRLVGTHPVQLALAEHVARHRGQLEQQGVDCSRLCSSSQTAEALVDLCQAAATGQAAQSAQLELICWWEWQLLLGYSLR